MADDLYERDFYLWTQAQAQALRTHGVSNRIEWEAVAEKVEDVGERERRAVQPLVIRIIEHLHKLRSTEPLLALLVALSLAACHDNISAAAADDAQVCYRATPGAAAKTAVVSAADDNLETCAMHLEGWRLIHKLPAVTGTYQGRYVYASAAAITSSAGPRDIRYRVYTPGQQADLDQKLNLLIARSASPAS